jgi:hypothetical protein
MSVNLYVVKLKPINIFNLPLALLHQALGNKVYDSCCCSIDNTGNIVIDIGKFALAQTNDPVNNFRTINWEDGLANLEASVDGAISQNKVIVFGTYKQDQIDFLKNHFKESIITIGVEYSENIYPKLLTMFAKKHIEHMVIGQLPMTEYDSDILAANSFDDAVAHYSKAFDQQELVPRTELDRCDLIIPLDDFYNITAIQQHIERLGILFNAPTVDFYNQWLTKQ